MHVELTTTPAGRERVEIDLGGDHIHSLSREDALKVANWIIELCPPTERAMDTPCGEHDHELMVAARKP